MLTYKKYIATGIVAIIFMSALWHLEYENAFAANISFTNNASGSDIEVSVGIPIDYIASSVVPRGVGNAATRAIDTFQKLVDATSHISNVLGKIALYAFKILISWWKTISQVPVGEAIEQVWNGVVQLWKETLLFFQGIFPVGENQR